MNDVELSFVHARNYKLVKSLSLAIFLYLFLLFFLPFGVDNYNPNHQYTFQFVFELGLFIILIFSVSMLNEFVIKPLFGIAPNWTFVIFWNIWTLFLLNNVVFLGYNILGNFHDFRLSSWIDFLWQGSSIFIFPLVGVIFFYRFKKLESEYNSMLTNVGDQIDPGQMITFQGQSANDRLTISVENFLFAATSDNYLELYYLKGGTLTKHLLRATLTSVSKTLDYPFLVRCHRSYLINVYNVSAIRGAKTNIRLSMKGIQHSIPVSSTYKADTVEKLRELKDFQ